MSASAFTFEIVSPERLVLRTTVRQVTAPTELGEITVLPSHVPLVSLLVPGVIEVVTEDGRHDLMAVSGGLIEIMAGKVVVLADTAERAAELDEAQVAEARARAEALKSQAERVDDVEFARLSAAIEKELAREKALKRWRRLNIGQ